MTTWTCVQSSSIFPVPFATWCSAACGSSPRAQHWFLTRGSRPSGGNGRWAPGGPAPPQWSRSLAHWGSGYAPSAPTLQKRTRSELLLNQKSCGWTNFRCSECQSSYWEKRFKPWSGLTSWLLTCGLTRMLACLRSYCLLIDEKNTDFLTTVAYSSEKPRILTFRMPPHTDHLPKHPMTPAQTRRRWLSSHWVLPHHSNSKKMSSTASSMNAELRMRKLIISWLQFKT